MNSENMLTFSQNNGKNTRSLLQSQWQLQAYFI